MFVGMAPESDVDVASLPALVAPEEADEVGVVVVEGSASILVPLTGDSVPQLSS